MFLKSVIDTTPVIVHILVMDPCLQLLGWSVWQASSWVWPLCFHSDWNWWYQSTGCVCHLFVKRHTG